MGYLSPSHTFLQVWRSHFSYYKSVYRIKTWEVGFSLIWRVVSQTQRHFVFRLWDQRREFRDPSSLSFLKRRAVEWDTAECWLCFWGGIRRKQLELCVCVSEVAQHSVTAPNLLYQLPSVLADSAPPPPQKKKELWSIASVGLFPLYPARRRLSGHNLSFLLSRSSFLVFNRGPAIQDSLSKYSCSSFLPFRLCKLHHCLCHCFEIQLSFKLLINQREFPPQIPNMVLSGFLPAGLIFKSSHVGICRGYAMYGLTLTFYYLYLQLFFSVSQRTPFQLHVSLMLAMVFPFQPECSKTKLDEGLQAQDEFIWPRER